MNDALLCQLRILYKTLNQSNFGHPSKKHKKMLQKVKEKNIPKIGYWLVVTVVNIVEWFLVSFVLIIKLI